MSRGGPWKWRRGPCEQKPVLFRQLGAGGEWQRGELQADEVVKLETAVESQAKEMTLCPRKMGSHAGPKRGATNLVFVESSLRCTWWWWWWWREDRVAESGGRTW